MILKVTYLFATSKQIKNKFVKIREIRGKQKKQKCLSAIPIS